MTNNLVCIFCEASSFRRTVSIPSFEILACKNCGIAITHPAPVLPKYEEMDFHADTEVTNLPTIDALPKDWQKSIRTEIELVKEFMPSGAAILEIGCGDGLLLGELQKLKFNCFGIEPSLSATKRALSKGLNVSQGYFPETMPKQKIDLVILTHVLEHVPDPIEFITAIKGILNPGGFILLAQTSYLGLIPRIQKGKWYAWVPEHHYWHFTKGGLETFMNRCNFSMTSTKFVSLVHPDDFLYKLSSLKASFKDQFISIFRKDVS